MDFLERETNLLIIGGRGLRNGSAKCCLALLERERNPTENCYIFSLSSGDCTQWNGRVVFKVSVSPFRQYFQPINDVHTSEIYLQITTFYDSIPHFTLAKYDFLRLYTTAHYY